MRVCILTRWVPHPTMKTPNGGPLYDQEVTPLLNPGFALTDTTAQGGPALLARIARGDPLPVVVEVDLDAASVAKVRADAGHGLGAVLWDDLAGPPEGQAFTTADHAALRGRLASLGFTPAQIDAAVGATTPAGKSKRDAQKAVQQWARGLT